MNTMNQMGENKYCQNCCADLTSMTNPDRRRALRIKKIWWKWKRYAWYIRVLGPVAYFKKRSAESQQTSTGKSPSAKAVEDSGAESQNLQVGDMVEVKSEREIFETLDSDGKLKGLRLGRPCASSVLAKATGRGPTAPTRCACISGMVREVGSKGFLAMVLSVLGADGGAR